MVLLALGSPENNLLVGNLDSLLHKLLDETIGLIETGINA